MSYPTVRRRTLVAAIGLALWFASTESEAQECVEQNYNQLWSEGACNRTPEDPNDIEEQYCWGSTASCDMEFGASPCRVVSCDDGCGECVPGRACIYGSGYVGGGSRSNCAESIDEISCTGPDDPLCVCGASAGQGPVLASSGTMYLVPRVDFTSTHPIGGGLEFKRYYSSHAAQQSTKLGTFARIPPPAGAFGVGWGHSYGDRLELYKNGAIWVREDLTAVEFKGMCNLGICVFPEPTSRGDRLEGLGNGVFVVTEATGRRRLIFERLGGDPRGAARGSCSPSEPNDPNCVDGVWVGDTTGTNRPGTARLREIQRPLGNIGATDEWVTAFEAMYFANGSVEPGCDSADNAGRLCKVVHWLNLAPARRGGELRFSWVTQADPCNHGPESRVSMLSYYNSDGTAYNELAPVASYAADCAPNDPSGDGQWMLSSAVVHADWSWAPARLDRAEIYYYEGNKEAPLLGRIDSSNWANPNPTTDTVEEVHTYYSGTCGSDCATCETANCRSVDACVTASDAFGAPPTDRCAGPRRIKRARYRCKTNFTEDPSDCEEDLAFEYEFADTLVEDLADDGQHKLSEESGIRAVLTHVTDNKTGRTWTVTSHRNRVRKVDGDCGCESPKSYEWEAGYIADQIATRRLRASVRPRADSQPASDERWDTFSYGATSVGLTKMLPTVSNIGDTDDDPTTLSGDPNAQKWVTEYFYELALVDAVYPPYAPGTIPAERRRVAFGYGTSGPVPACGSLSRTPASRTLTEILSQGLTAEGSDRDTLTCEVRRSLLDYDSYGRLTSTESTNGHDRRDYVYYTLTEPGNDAGRLKELRIHGGSGSAAAVVVRFEQYGRSGLPRRISQPFLLGAQPTAFSELVYDGMGRVAKILQAGATAPSELFYDHAGRITEVRSPVGASVRFEYDAWGLLTRTEARNASGLVYAEADYQRDADSHLVKDWVSRSRIDGTMVLQRHEKYVHDNLRRLIAVTTWRGATEGELETGVTVFHRDGAGRLQWIADGPWVDLPNGPGLGTYSAACDMSDSHLCEAGCGAQDYCHVATIHLTYDSLGRLEKIFRQPPTAASGQIPNELRWSLTRDHIGRVTQVKDPDSQVSDLEWTEFDELRKITTPDTGVTRYSFDANGRTTERRGANQSGPETWTWDVASRLTKRAIASGDTVRFEYGDTTAWANQNDCAGLPLPQPNATGKLACVIDEDSIGERSRDCWGYDAAGAIAWQASQRKDEGCFRVTKWNRDGDGRLTSMVYPTGRVVTYDYLGSSARVPSAVRTTFGGVPTTIVDQIESADGRVLSYRLGSGLKVTLSRSLGGDRLGTEVKDDATGRVWVSSTTRLDGSGVPEEIVRATNQVLGSTLNHDNHGRLISAYTSGQGGPTPPDLSTSSIPFCRETYPVGPAADRQEKRFGCGTGFVTETYSFRPDSKFLSSRSYPTSTGSVTNHYCNGTWANVIPGSPGTCSQAGAGLAGAVRSIKTQTIKNGASTIDETLLTWDDWLRLTSATKGGISTQYGYDGLRQRATKKYGANQARTQFWYGLGGELIAEDAYSLVAAQFPRELREYVWLEGELIAVLRSSSSGYVSGTNKSFVKTDVANGIGYVHNDEAGFPLAITNPATKIVWRAERTPFGEARILSITGGGEIFKLPNVQILGSVPSSGSPPATNKSQTWTILAPPGASGLQVHFSSFDLENCVDYVVVKRIASGVELARYTGNLGAFWSSTFYEPGVMVTYQSDATDCTSIGCVPKTCQWAGGTCGKGYSCSNPALGGFELNEVKAIYSGWIYNLRFPGQYYDAESGLIHNGWRPYEPGTGRFLSPDPKIGSDHPYNYTPASPYMYVDVDGRHWDHNGVPHFGEGSDPATRAVTAWVGNAAMAADDLQNGEIGWALLHAEMGSAGLVLHGGSIVMEVFTAELVLTRALAKLAAFRAAGAAAAGCEAAAAGEGTTRVGRWMSDAEAKAMVESGRVQAPLNGAGATHVTVPPNPSAFRPPPQSTTFVEFDVPTSQLRVHDAGNGWGRVFGPGSLEGRAAAAKGLPLPTEMPPATNIKVTAP